MALSFAYIKSMHLDQPWIPFPLIPLSFLPFDLHMYHRTEQ